MQFKNRFYGMLIISQFFLRKADRKKRIDNMLEYASTLFL